MVRHRLRDERRRPERLAFRRARHRRLRPRCTTGDRDADVDDEPRRPRLHDRLRDGDDDEDELGEIRGDGSYTLLPFSRHPSGVLYEWAILPGRTPFVSYSRDLFEPATGRTVPTLVYEGWHGRDEEWAARVMVALGIEARSVRSPFRCPIPGHEERHPSASLFRMPSGVWMLRDWHGRGRRAWVPLADVFASRLLGEEVELGTGERRSWLARLEVEMGVREPLPVSLPRLPARASESVRRVSEGFRLLLAVEGAESAPFSRRFAARWCGPGLGEMRAGRAIDRLRAADVLRVEKWERFYGREKGAPGGRVDAGVGEGAAGGALGGASGALGGRGVRLLLGVWAASGSGERSAGAPGCARCRGDRPSGDDA